MSEKERLETIFFGSPPKGDTSVYLKWTKGEAMADYIVRHARTLEVPISYQVPSVEFLEDTKRNSRGHGRYFADGGTDWPDRWMVSSNARPS